MKKKTSINLIAFAFAFLFFFGATGTPSAAIVVFTDETAWLEAVSNLSGVTQTEDLGSGVNVFSAGTTDIGPFDVTIDGNSEGDGYIGIFSGVFRGDIDYDYNWEIVFDNFDQSPIFGFAGYWGSTTTGDFLTLTVNGETIYFGDELGYNQFNDGSGGDGFLGILDDEVPITSMVFDIESFNDYGEGFTLSDISIASYPVPAPAAILLFGVGLLGLTGIGRKRK